MVDVFRVLWRSLRDVYDEMFMLMGVNSFTLLMCLPIVTIPPALAGAAFVAHRVAHGLAFAPRDFWVGFRMYLWDSWKVALPSLLGWFLLAINLLFYSQQPDPYMRLLVILWAFVGFVWLAVQFYLSPLLVYQRDKSLRALFKNAAILAVSRPLFNLVLLAIVVILAAGMVLSGVLAALFLFVVVSVIGAVALRFHLEPQDWDKRGEAETKEE
ncbi:MAG: hypothetical protein QHH80_10375 [Anaerolineae bacterium]|nr:hypothetical protein [Anaerolineae bacterium]